MMEGSCVNSELGEEMQVGAGDGRRDQGAAGGEGEGRRDDEGWIVVCSKKRKLRNSLTPEVLRKMGSCGEKIDFEGFDQEESGNQGNGGEQKME